MAAPGLDHFCVRLWISAKQSRKPHTRPARRAEALTLQLVDRIQDPDGQKGPSTPLQLAGWARDDVGCRNRTRKESMITITDPFTALGEFVVTLHGHPFGAVVLVALAWLALA